MFHSFATHSGGWRKILFCYSRAEWVLSVDFCLCVCAAAALKRAPDMIWSLCFFSPRRSVVKPLNPSLGSVKFAVDELNQPQISVLVDLAKANSL